MAAEAEYGRCDVCGKSATLVRTVFEYDFKCQCHSPNHFELVRHCTDCTPEPPKETTVTVKPTITHHP